jgi:uncharacterized protein
MSDPTMNMLRCPKCPGVMRTYERNGVKLEQCDSCRGIFLDFGELEALTRLEAHLSGPPPQAYPQQHAQPYPPQYPPQSGWGHGYSHGHKRKHHGFGGLFYSS